MALRRCKSPGLWEAGADRGVVHAAEPDNHSNRPDLFELQAEIVGRRFQLAPSIARVVASLAYQEVRP
jgi:hypothetical protein